MEAQLVTTRSASRLHVFLSRLLSKVGYKHRLYLECPFESGGDVDASDASVSIRELRTIDADSFVEFREGPDAALFLKRIQSGQRCYAAFVADRLASVSWAAQGTPTLWAFNADFRIGDDVVYVFDSYTHPDFRGRRLQASIFQGIRLDSDDKGVRTAVTFVAATNTANLRSRARLGFVISGAVRRLRVGPWVWYFSSGNAPELKRHSPNP
jgi:L-amino acid N-acyltransferase YncA